MSRVKIFVNLTNGIEALDMHRFKLDEVYFMRIQSTYCEQHHYEEILHEIDHNFLMLAALGYSIRIYDYGVQAGLPKALYLGINWIKYVLRRRWFARKTEIIAKDKKITHFFEEIYDKLSKSTKKRIDYYKNFLFCEDIDIEEIPGYTDKDGDKEYYRKVIERALKNEFS